MFCFIPALLSIYIDTLFGFSDPGRKVARRMGAMCIPLHNISGLHGQNGTLLQRPGTITIPGEKNPLANDMHVLYAGITSGDSAPPDSMRVMSL